MGDMFSLGEAKMSQMIGLIAERRGVRLDRDDPAFVLVELNQMALQPFYEKLQELGEMPDLAKELAAFKTSLSEAIIKGNERILQAVGSLERLNAAGGSPAIENKPSADMEMFKLVHEQWAADAKYIGQNMDTVQRGMEELLKNVAALQSRSTAPVPGQVVVPQIKIIAKPVSRWAAVLPVMAAVILTASFFLGTYYFSNISKSAELGAALTRDWSKLDLPTRTKITNVIGVH